MRALRGLLRALFVTHRSLTVVGVLWCTTIVVAISTGFWLTWRLSYVLMAVVPLAYVWSKINLRGLEIIADRTTDRLQEGAQYEERITVRNRTWLSKIWLEINDPSDRMYVVLTGNGTEGALPRPPAPCH